MILTGLARLGRDAEVRFLPDGTAVSNLSLAYNYGMKPKDGSNKPTQWIDATVWGKLAEVLQPYLKKGGLIDVIVEDVHIETYQKTGGGEGVKLAGRVLKIELAGGREAGDQTQGSSAPQQRTQSPSPAPQRQAPAGGTDFDDDIPF